MLSDVMLSVIMLNVIMLSAVMLNAIMLSVVMPNVLEPAVDSGLKVNPCLQSYYTPAVFLAFAVAKLLKLFFHPPGKIS
jgi:hypothetical protein